MRKLDLNIQLFASTNKTTNYELPQFIGTDKPTWLGDFNTAMADIDAGMAENASDISDMQSDVATATSTASQASQDVASLTSTVSSLSTDVTNATTTANNASATASSALNTANSANSTATTANTTANTANSKADAISAKLNLDSFETIGTSSMTKTGSGTIASGGSIYTAKNADGSICKIYGSIDINTGGGSGNITIPTSLRPESQLTINGLVIREIRKDNLCKYVDSPSVTIATNGNVTVPYTYRNETGDVCKIMFMACLLFLKEFNDEPIPEPEA